MLPCGSLAGILKLQTWSCALLLFYGATKPLLGAGSDLYIVPVHCAALVHIDTMLWLHPHQTSIMHATVQPCSACARHSASQSRCNIPQCNAHALSSQLESHTRPTSCLESTRVGCHSMRQSSTLLAAVASERPAMQASGGRVQDGDAGVVDSTDAVCESLSLLEWDTLCRQVCAGGTCVAC